MTLPPPHPLRVVVDPGLKMARPLQQLLPTLAVTDNLTDAPSAQVAVLTIPLARSMLPALPLTTTVMVIVNRHQREPALDLYAAGAAMVIIDPPVEEVSARIRAVARHLDELSTHGHATGA
jgi:hypothetical protein